MDEPRAPGSFPPCQASITTVNVFSFACDTGKTKNKAITKLIYRKVLFTTLKISCKFGTNVMFFDELNWADLK